LLLGKLSVVALRRLIKVVPANTGFFVSCGIIVAIGVVLAVTYQGEFTQLTLMKAGAVYFLAPSLVVLVAWGLVTLLRRRNPTPIWRAAFVWVVFAVGMGLSFAMGYAINQWKIEAAKSFVLRAIPVLDKMVHDEGAVPASLPASLGKPPILLQYCGRWQGDKNFSFTYSDPSEFDAQYILTGSDRSWRFLPD
jgi:hypothetical protein